MAHFLIASLATALVAAGAATAAEARDRSFSGSVTGPRGHTATVQGSRSCSGGVCTGTRTWTGPGGRSATRARDVTGIGTGSATSTTTWTGPGGRTATREGTRSCSGGTCTVNGTITGPAGHQSTYSGTVTRY